MSDKELFDRLREMSGGTLTQQQVDGVNAVLTAGLSGAIREMFKVVHGVTMSVSLNGMAILAGFEGFRADAYLDGAGVWTIGFGTTIYPNGIRVKKGDTCTREQALIYKKHDVQFFEKHVNRIITVPLKQNQFDALVCLVYNIGVGAFESGSVDNLINSGKVAEAVSVWSKYRNVRNPKTGKLEVSKGLVNRRTAEISLFMET